MSRTTVISLPYATRWAAAAVIALSLSLERAAAQGPLPSGFVYLRDIDPTIAQDIRYAGPDNFVGRKLAGYEAGECILRRDVAAALARVQADLQESGLALKVYDCYRPERSVRAMVQWASDGRGAGTGKRFFPRLQKHTLFALGYIAASSRHSTGTAVDLTLIEPSRPPVAAFDPAAAYAPCTGKVSERAPENSVDMGTGYDCFDVASHTRNVAVGPEPQRWRRRLVTAMARRGFANYFREWWHFSYAVGVPAPHYDFPIAPRSAKALVQ